MYILISYMHTLELIFLVLIQSNCVDLDFLVMYIISSDVVGLTEISLRKNPKFGVI